MKTTLEFSAKEIEQILKDHVKRLNAKYEADKVSFTVSDIADDRFGGGPRYELISASITTK
jgi:hypothetical protein